MCGIAGFLERSSRGLLERKAVANAMANRLHHRGPDDGGVWVDQVGGIAFAHRRLSVLDLSPAGHQPMHSGSGRWTIVFNGEVYNHLELREQLTRSGMDPKWRGHSDTETILSCVEAWGVQETLRRCTGMFALALWDGMEKALWLARDRLGEKPLYFGWQGETFLFGSELRALRAHPAFNAGVDRGALTLLTRQNYIPAPYSIYKGIGKLPQGTWLRLGQGEREVSVTPYWSLAEVAERGAACPFGGSDAEAIEQLEAHLTRAIRGQMIADVPLGALLSGGVDSTAVAAVMQSNSTKPIRTFTIGFEEKHYDEAAHARSVASHLGTDHTELRFGGRDALGLVPELASIFDEPFADSSQLPTHLVLKLARRNVTVALSGDGGDELLGGYNRYVHGPKTWRRIGWMPPFLRRAVGACLMAVPSEIMNHTLGDVAKVFGVAQPGDKAHKLGSRLALVRSADDLNVSLISEWQRDPAIVVGGYFPENIIDDRSRWPRLRTPVERIMALDSLTYLPDDILVKVDRASMAVSLETRAPFLDHHLVEFSWSLPVHMKIRRGQGKWLLRRLVDRHVPAELMNRPKMGFGVPLDYWLRGPLRDWAESLISEVRLKSEGYFDPGPIRAAWVRHQRREASFGHRLWSVLMFQSWLEFQTKSGESLP